MQPVYDDDYWPKELADNGWPPQWAPVEAGAAGGWKAASDGRSFSTDGSASGEVWLGYRHTPPEWADWASLLGVSRVRPPAPKPQLIRDFTAYDTTTCWYYGKPGDLQAARSPPSPLPGGLGQPPDPRHPSPFGLNWVGDLIVEFQLNVSGASGDVLVDLVKGGHQFVCRLDLAGGKAEVSIRGVAGFHASAAGIRGPGEHRVRFANVDQQLLLWLDGKLAKFDSPTTYERKDVDIRVPDKEDLMPARIGSRGAAVEVSHLRLYRDIYYVAQRPSGEYVPPTDLDATVAGYPYGRSYYEDPAERAAQFFSDWTRWQIFGERLGIEFKLGPGQFFMLGDNSAESKDSRLWDERRYYVSRDLLVGRALFVYWPHSWDRVPGTRIPFPFFPNFSRMRLIR